MTAGSNLLPTVHIRDLVQYVLAIAREDPGIDYILAVDGGYATQKGIVEGISKTLGTGASRYFNRLVLVWRNQKANSALSSHSQIAFVHQHTLDLTTNTVLASIFWMIRQIRGPELLFHKEAELYTVHLPMTPSILQNMQLTSKGLLLSLGDICQEYLNARNLSPLKILIMGPPMAGKSELCRALSEVYDVPHIDAQSILQVVHTADEELQKEVNTELKSKSCRVSDANMARLCRILLTSLPNRNKVHH